MATKEEIFERVIKPMTANYGPINSDDVEAFRDLLIRALSPHSAEVLDRAVDRIVMTRKYKKWPTIADIIEAVKATGRAGKEDGKTRYPNPMRGVDYANFWNKSQEFVERDYESRGTCLHYVRRGTFQWESWAIYFDVIGLDAAVLRSDGWYAPSEWPWQFDTDNGSKCSVPPDFEEYEVDSWSGGEYKEPTPEEKARIVDLWQKLRKELLKKEAKQAII